MLGALGLLLSSLIRQRENFTGVMNFVIFPMFFLSSALASTLLAGAVFMAAALWGADPARRMRRKQHSAPPPPHLRPSRGCTSPCAVLYPLIMRHLLAAAAALCATLAAAQDDAGGTLNPPEMGMDRVMQNIREGKPDMMTCASGYYKTKKGDHDDARAIFESCANAGYTGSMTWMSQLDTNGLGAPEDPAAAAEWDRRAAEAGDPVGQFNYGLTLLRGYGVARDLDAGRAYVDAAAAQGLPVARRLQQENYDPNEVTPDADEWKFAPKLF